MKKLPDIYCLLLALAFFAPALHAATVFTPIGATSSAASLDNRPITDAIDGSGLSGSGLSGDILSETHGDGGSNSGPYYLGANAMVLTFDLGAVETVNAVHIWNYTRSTQDDRAIKGFDISFSNDNVTYTTVPTVVTGFAALTWVSGIAVPVQSQSFTSQSGRYIKLENMTNYGDVSYTGFGEIRFSAVPEPSAALLGGLGALLLLRRRRI